MASNISYNCSNIWQSFAAINLNAIIPKDVLEGDQGDRRPLTFFRKRLTEGTFY